MRRTARALSVAVLAGSALVIAGPASFADPAIGADPSADASPGIVQPGGPASASAACDTPTGLAPEAHEATPQAFEDLRVRLSRRPGTEGASGPAPARSGADDCPAGPDKEGTLQAPDKEGTLQAPDEEGTLQAPDEQGGKAWTPDSVPGATESETEGADDGGSCAQGQHCTGGQGERGDGRDQGQGQSQGQGQGQSQGQGWESDDPATVQGGVEAGAGGTFNDSVPALVIGGVLIVAACAGAVYRLSGRRRFARG